MRRRSSARSKRGRIAPPRAAARPREVRPGSSPTSKRHRARRTSRRLACSCAARRRGAFRAGRGDAGERAGSCGGYRAVGNNRDGSVARVLLGERRRVRECVGPADAFSKRSCIILPGEKLRASSSRHETFDTWHPGGDFLRARSRDRFFFHPVAKGESRARLTDAFDRFQSTSEREKRSSRVGRRSGGARRRTTSEHTTARERAFLSSRSFVRFGTLRGAHTSRAAPRLSEAHPVPDAPRDERVPG